MLTKHFDNVRQKSENFRVLYAITASILFTGVVGGVWIFSWFIPNLNTVDSSASVATAIDGGSLSPTGIVKQEAGNVFDSFFDSIKGLTQKKFMGGQYEVKYDNGTLGLSQNAGVQTGVGATDDSGVLGSSVSDAVYSTTTSSGVTVEADRVDESLDSVTNPITPENADVGIDAEVSAGN
jgi:hypothetical protein